MVQPITITSPSYPPLLGTIGSPKGASSGRQERPFPGSPRPRSSRTSPANSEPHFPLSSPHSSLLPSALSGVEDPDDDSAYIRLQQPSHAYPSNVYFSNPLPGPLSKETLSPSVACRSCSTRKSGENDQTLRGDLASGLSSPVLDVSDDALAHAVTFRPLASADKDAPGPPPPGGSLAVSRRADEADPQEAQGTAKVGCPSFARQISLSTHFVTEKEILASPAFRDNQENIRLPDLQRHPPSGSAESRPSQTSSRHSTDVASPRGKQVSVFHKGHSRLSTQHRHVSSPLSPRPSLASSPTRNETVQRRSSSGHTSHRQQGGISESPLPQASSPCQADRSNNTRRSPKHTRLAMASPAPPPGSLSALPQSPERRRGSLRRISVTSAASGAQEASLFRDPSFSGHSTLSPLFLRASSPLRCSSSPSSSSPRPPPRLSPHPQAPVTSLPATGSSSSWGGPPPVCATPERGRRRSPEGSSSPQQRPPSHLPEDSRSSRTPEALPLRSSSSLASSLRETPQQPPGAGSQSGSRGLAYEDTAEARSCPPSVLHTYRSDRSMVSFSTESSPLLRSPSPRSESRPPSLPSYSVATPLSRCASSSASHKGEDEESLPPRPPHLHRLLSQSSTQQQRPSPNPLPSSSSSRSSSASPSPVSSTRLLPPQSRSSVDTPNSPSSERRKPEVGRWGHASPASSSFSSSVASSSFSPLEKMRFSTCLARDEAGTSAAVAPLSPSGLGPSDSGPSALGDLGSGDGTHASQSPSSSPLAPEDEERSAVRRRTHRPLAASSQGTNSVDGSKRTDSISRETARDMRKDKGGEEGGEEERQKMEDKEAEVEALRFSRFSPSSSFSGQEQRRTSLQEADEAGECAAEVFREKSTAESLTLRLTRGRDEGREK